MTRGVWLLSLPSVALHRPSAAEPGGGWGGVVRGEQRKRTRRRRPGRSGFTLRASAGQHVRAHVEPQIGKEAHYDDNIAYMDKQVGAVVAELERLGLREKTLVIFTADNGTALNYPSEIGGRMSNGKKASMLEGGSRVPFIASWPGTTPAGKVSKDILSFADPHATFAELAGVQLPATLKFDGRSFAPQLQGQPGQPREWAYVQLGQRWFVREQGFKMNEQGELFDMRDAPFVETPIAPDADTEASKAARARLTAALAELNPAAGKTDQGGGASKAAKKAKKKAKAV